MNMLSFCPVKTEVGGDQFDLISYYYADGFSDKVFGDEGSRWTTISGEFYYKVRISEKKTITKVRQILASELAKESFFTNCERINVKQLEFHREEFDKKAKCLTYLVNGCYYAQKNLKD